MTEPIQSHPAPMRSGAVSLGRSIDASQLKAGLHSGIQIMKARLALEGRREVARLGLLIAAHIVIWWAVALVVHAPSDIHNDMAEAFSWGQELQWGYYKHPPFWAWVAGVWFSIFPATDWAFYLLSVVNSAIGLIGVWAVAGRYVTGAPRLAAVLLLELVPFHHFFAFNYNANSIQLSLWPWAIYVFIVSFESRRVTASVGFGIFAAATVLSKYFGGVLVASCLLAAITNQHARVYFRSAAPYVSVLTFAICIAPHVAWSLDAAIGPIDRLIATTQYPFWFILEKAAKFVTGCILLHGVLAIVLFAVWQEMREAGTGLTPGRARSLLGRPRVRLLFVLAGAPFIITVLVALFGNVRLSTKFALPVFSLIPLVWIILYRAKFGGRSIQAAMFSVGILMAGSIAIAIPTAALKLKYNNSHFAEPRSIVAHRITELWHSYVGTPLRVVAGTESYALATTFYSADHPSDFTDFSMVKAPWIDEARLNRDGLAIICVFHDEACMDQVWRFQALDSVRLTLSDVSKSDLGIAGERFSFVVLLVKPRQRTPASRSDCCGEPVNRDGNRRLSPANESPLSGVVGAR